MGNKELLLLLLLLLLFILLNSTFDLNVEFINSVEFNKIFLSKGKIYLLQSRTRSVSNLVFTLS